MVRKVAAYNFFGPTGDLVGMGGGNGVELGGVEEVYATTKSVVDLGVGFFLGVLHTPGHGAEADLRDAEG